MTKVTLNDLADLQNETTATNTLNSNNAVIETAFDNTLSRDGTFPNQMLSVLDMNSNRIINLPEPLTATEPLRMEDVTDFNTGLATLTSIVNGLVIGSGSSLTGITATGVIATSVPNGISSIQTSGYYSAGDGGGALYILVGSTTPGLYSITSANGKIWQLGVNQINPRFCGAKGDGVTDDRTAILAARDHAQTADKTLVFTDGVYVSSGTLDFSKSHFHVLAQGSRVTIKGTGSTQLVVFDGGGSVFTDQTFGGTNKFYLTSSGSVSDLLYTHNVSHSSFDVLCGSSQGSSVRIDTVVCNKYNIESSTITASFPIKPVFGVIGTGIFDCKFDLILEGIGSVGNYVLNIDNAFENQFWGTAESSVGGGVNIGVNAFRNTFIGFDCEFNATGGGHEADWLIQGYENIFIGCQGQGTYDGVHTANFVLGHQNTFINCDFSGLRNQSTSNSYDGCNLTSFTDAGVSTVIKRCTGAADTMRNSQVFAGNTNTVLTIPAANQFIGNAGMSSTEFLVQMRMPTAGTISNLFVQTTGSPGAGQIYAFVMRKNNANASIAVNIPAGFSTGSDTTNTFTVVPGDLVCLEVISTTTAAATNIIWSWQFNAS